MIRFCCKDCKHRHEKCHVECSDYLKAKSEHDKIRERMQLDQMITETIVSGVYRVAKSGINPRRKK